MTINVPYEVNVEKIAQDIIDINMCEYFLDEPYDFEDLSEDQQRKIVTEVANQMIIIANNFD